MDEATRRPAAKPARLAAYRRQAARLERRLAALDQAGSRTSWVRLLVFAGGLTAAVTAYFALGGRWFGLLLALTLAGFVAAVAAHRRIEGAQARGRAWRSYALQQIARGELAWEELPPSTAEPRFDHPFEGDLDLVGDRSLHRLLNVAVTAGGAARLRDWLATPTPDAAAIAQRQTLVAELIPRTLFRARLAVDATGAAPAGERWQPEALLGWLAGGSPWRRMHGPLLLLAGLAALNAAAALGDYLDVAGPFWRYTLPLYAGVYLLLARGVSAALGEAQPLSGALEQLAGVFRHVERYGYAGAPALRSLCAPLTDAAVRPSAHLSRIRYIVAAAGVRGNPVVWALLNAAVPWDYYFSYRLHQAKAAAAAHMPLWIDTLFELEALASLANLGALNPEYSFPSVQRGASAPPFTAAALGHPLLRDQERVCNDFTLTELGEVALITGSNMAGKSTFLRTVGVNLALAYAGGPVNAVRLETSLFRLFTCIKVSDSIADGISYFYAEVKRLRRLLDALEAEHPLPLLFLIDEIFRGTNNRERLLGSRAYVRALAGKHGVGLISTHDLELTRLADELPQLVNYHFRDDIREGRMVFDYLLRRGPCPTTNALKLMALEGLPTPPAA